MATELVTYADLKAILGLDQATIPAALSVIRDSVSVRIEQYLGRKLATGTYTESVEITDPTRMIYLTALPITSVTSVAVTSGYGDTLSLTYQSDFRLSQSYGLNTFIPWADRKSTRPNSKQRQ